MKILLVSDVHHFSTWDVYRGYVEGFKTLKVPFEEANMADLVNYYNIDMAWGLVLTKMLKKDNEFTHALFISGIIVPSWIYQSKYDKKVGVIATDDPHAGKILLDQKQYLDYYFTNEKLMENEDANIFYIPTATSSKLPTMSKPEINERYRSNVCFVGTMYDDRIKPMEDICRYCEEKNLKIKIVGPLLNTPKNSIIRKYADMGDSGGAIIRNEETKLLYRGTDVVINIDRNVKWSAVDPKGNQLLYDVGQPYSANPRMYEIAGCRTPQLFVNARKEPHDIFGDNVYYCDSDTVKEGLDQIFNEDSNILLDKINNCFNIVKQGHLYTHRAAKLLSCIKKIDERNML